MPPRRAHARFSAAGRVACSLWQRASNEKIICIKCGCCRLISPSPWQQRALDKKLRLRPPSSRYVTRAPVKAVWKTADPPIRTKYIYIAGLAQRNLLALAVASAWPIRFARMHYYLHLYYLPLRAFAIQLLQECAQVVHWFWFIYQRRTARLNVNSWRAVCCPFSAAGYFRREINE